MNAPGLRIAAVLCAAVALQAQGGQRQSAPARPTFRAATRLIEVTVVVQDSDHHPVAGLTRGDFTLYEEGQEQRIELFEVQSDPGGSLRAAASGPNEVAWPAGKAGSPPGVFSNDVGGRAQGGITVILLDRVNSSAEDQSYARGAVLKFLGQVRPEDRVALYLLDPGGVQVVHDFTNDAGALIRAAIRHRPRPNDPDAASSIGPATGDAEIDEVLSGTFQKIEGWIVQNRVETTRLALEAIAHHLAAVQGRKSLIWLSSGFPVLSQDGKGGPITFSRQMNRATRAVNDASIAIYPIDDRGLIPGYLGTIAATRTRGAGTPSPETANNSDRLNTFLTQDSMQILASETGGRAFTNTNDITTAVRRAIDDSRVTYVLGYYPSHDKWDGRFRAIKVRVGRPGVSVRHRAGYVAAPAMADDQNTRQEALMQLARSPLPATGVGLKAEIEPIGAGKGEVAITISVEPRTVTLQKNDETWNGVLDVLIVQSLPDGTLVKSFGAAVGLNFATARRELFMKEGLTLTRTVTVRPDAIQLRLLVRDAPSGSTGSVIVPVAKITRQ